MIYDKAHELAKAIKNSPEHRQFKELKEKVAQNEESMKILQDFHAKQLEIQAQQMMGQEISQEKMQELEKMSQILQYHPAVRDFLQVEYRLAQILTDVQRILAEGLDLELPKMKE